MNPSTIGVDISKDFLDVHRLADGASRRFANDKSGRKALIKWLIAAPAKSVVFEPTGSYHRALERALDAAGLPIAEVNPRQARRFAEAAGKLVKTIAPTPPCARAWARFLASNHGLASAISSPN